MKILLGIIFGIILFVPAMIFLLFAVIGLIAALAVLIGIIYSIIGTVINVLIFVGTILWTKKDSKSNHNRLDDLCRKLQRDL